MTEEWRFRPGTLDEAIFNAVVLFNEYRLPGSLAAADIVLDIGAHTGSFAQAAVSRGCEHVYSVEPDQANIEMASGNLSSYIASGFVRLIRGAVWRSDANDDQLRFDGYHQFPRSYVEMSGILNTGNGSVIWGAGEPVEKIAFDDLVDIATDNGKKRVRFLKLDCEGAEWPILLTSQRLHLVDEIAGEFHEIGGPYLEISEDREIQVPIFGFRDSSENQVREPLEWGGEGRPPVQGVSLSPGGASFAMNDSSGFRVEMLMRFLDEAGFEAAYSRHERPGGALEGLGLFFARRRVLRQEPADE